jgi:acyl transferase domain-containing protein
VNYTVDAACASSLTAVYQGVLELESGRSDMVLAGGIDTVQGPFGYLCFSKTRALSPRGRCSSFEADADGIVISEGLAMVGLKRLADAERDGDKIYAVIKGVGGSSDGKAKSMTAPHPDGQIRALNRAYEMAGYSPATVGLFEAHGTGTVVGDTAEMATVTRLLHEAGAPPRSAAIGSVKTQIGHTKAAAGIAGMIKATLALHHGVLPPHGRKGAVNAKLNDADMPLYLVDRPRPWLTTPGTPRRAGVSAFGFGGTNFHVTLEEYSGKAAIPALAPVARNRWAQELLIWRAPNRGALARQVQALIDRLAQGWQPSLADLAYTLYAKAPAKGLTAAIVVGEAEDLAAKLAPLAAHLADPAKACPPGAAFSDAPLLDEGKLALIFPGQGTTYPEMHADVAALFPAFADSLAEADAVLAEAIGGPLSRLILPAGAYDEAQVKAAAATLTRTDIAQPALGAVEAGMLAVFQSLGLAPDMAAGHSYGEFVALHAAGVFSRADLFRVSHARGSFMVEAGQGGDLGSMAAARAPRDVLDKLIAGIDGVVVANHNAPEQSILSGTRAGLDEAAKRAEAQGLKLTQLSVGAAFHSPIVAPAADKLAAYIKKMDLGAPALTVYANATGKPYPASPKGMIDTLARQLAAPVEFVAEIEQMYADGARVFLSLGPKTSHAALVRQILGDRPHRAIASDDEAGGLKGLLGGHRWPSGRRGGARSGTALGRAVLHALGPQGPGHAQGGLGQAYLDAQRLWRAGRVRPAAQGADPRGYRRQEGQNRHCSGPTDTDAVPTRCTTRCFGSPAPHRPSNRRIQQGDACHEHPPRHSGAGRHRACGHWL